MRWSDVIGAVSQAVRAALLVLLAVLLQVTVATDLDVLGGRPDLVVIVVVSIALLRAARWRAPWRASPPGSWSTRSASA